MAVEAPNKPKYECHFPSCSNSGVKLWYPYQCYKPGDQDHWLNLTCFVHFSKKAQTYMQTNSNGDWSYQLYGTDCTDEYSQYEWYPANISRVYRDSDVDNYWWDELPWEKGDAKSKASAIAAQGI